jgi:hypothetical protein
MLVFQQQGTLALQQRTTATRAAGSLDTRSARVPSAACALPWDKILYSDRGQLQQDLIATGPDRKSLFAPDL